VNWAYVAGFFDGEGTIGLRQNGQTPYGFYPRLAIAQSGERGETTLKEVQEFLFQNGIKSGVCRSGKKPGYQPGYALSVASRNSVTKFLNNILLYSRIKRREAQDMLRMLILLPALRNGAKIKPPKVATCHPDRKHKAKNLCSACYLKQRAA
jgi:intein/homing endonuclease